MANTTCNLSIHMTDLSLADTHSFIGDWCVPPSQGASEHSIPGTLEWSVNGGTLTLHEALTAHSGPIYGVSDTQAVAAIYGRSLRGQAVTVLGALPVTIPLPAPLAGPKQSQVFRNSLCVIGAHVEPDALFSCLKFRMPGLDLWLDAGGIQQTIQSTPLKIIYEVQPTEAHQVDIPSKGLKLVFEMTRNMPAPMGTDVTISSTGWMKVLSDAPGTFDKLFEQAEQAMRLLSFMSGSPMTPDTISATLQDQTQVSVLLAVDHKRTCTFKRPHDFFMRRLSLGMPLEVAFRKWYDMLEKADLASKLAQAIFSSEGLWMHVEFLSLMQALEGLHRSLMPGTYCDKDAYDVIARAITGAIPASVDSEHKDSLKARIKYGNEHSLRKRLKNLLSDLPLAVRQLTLLDRSIPGSWVDTRNYYTHWDAGSGSNVLKDHGMHRANVCMRVLLRLLYLHQVGIPEPQLLAALRSPNSEVQYLNQLNALEIRRANPASTVGAIAHIGLPLPSEVAQGAPSTVESARGRAPGIKLDGFIRHIKELLEQQARR